MIGVHEQDQFLGEQRLELQLRSIDGEVHDRRIELAVDQPWHQRRGAALVDGGVDAGVLLGETAEQSRHQPASRGADAAEARLAFDRNVVGMDVGFDVLEFVDDASATFDDDRALFGELAGRSIDERRAEFLLEPGDVCGDVALHRAEGAGGGRKRPMVGDGDQAGQMADFHGDTVSRI